MTYTLRARRKPFNRDSPHRTSTPLIMLLKANKNGPKIFVNNCGSLMDCKSPIPPEMIISHEIMLTERGRVLAIGQWFRLWNTFRMTALPSRYLSAKNFNAYNFGSA